MGAVKHWASAVMYWNLVLDENNGPNILPPTSSAEEILRGLVQFDRQQNRLDYQIEYFALGHASKFIKSGSVRIASSTLDQGKEVEQRQPSQPWTDLESLAFLTPEGRRVLLVLNPSPVLRRIFDVQWQESYFSFSLDQQSAVSFIW